ncbi:hypothetical protein HPB50_001488 [Hyalomma asiaticum]|uniref:Uncharacterized protein n=1 Tax=Hyalomma asiaticum TaxID=266040 RepID=A0ACB7RTP4_HYAAI|nr:hypothetical protein HPB50_001488 [Hyalomma asiaticum]
MASQRSNARGGPSTSRDPPTTCSASFKPELDVKAANDRATDPQGVGASANVARNVPSENSVTTTELEDWPVDLIPPTGAAGLAPLERSNAAPGRTAHAEDPNSPVSDGRYQLEALFCATCSHLVMLCHNLLHNIVAPQADHWCRPPAEYANLTLAQWRSVSEPSDDRGQPRRCERFVPPLSVLAANRTTLPCDSVVYDASSHGRTIVGDWNLACDRGWLLPASFAAYMWGAALGALVAGHVADKVGRRPATLVATFGLLGCGMGICFADTFLEFAALRFGVSAFVCGVQVTTYVLLFEVTARARRTLYCVVATGVGLTFGPILVYALVELSRSWVVTQAIVMLPTSLLGLAVLCTTEESPRWLLAKLDLQRTESAALQAAMLNRGGDLQDALTDRRLQTAQAQSHSLPKTANPEASKDRGGCLLLRPRLLRPVVAVLYWCWFTALLSYYSHAMMRARFGVGTATASWLNLTAVVLQMPGSVATYLSMRRLGRRSTLWLLLCLLSLVAAMDAVMLSARGHRDHAVLFLYALTGVLVDQYVMLLFAYSVEIFPTCSRGAAVSGANFCGRLGAASAPALSSLLGAAGLGGEAVPEIALLSLMAALAGLGALSLPDTVSLAMWDRMEEEGFAGKRLLRLPRDLTRASTLGVS